MIKEHYQHLERFIHDYFAGQGMKVAIEPRGSHGPDLEGIKGTLLAGEIKHLVELNRDLPGKFWKDWNSNQKFGGKTNDFKITTVLPSDVNSLSEEALGWIAVVYGQLNHYREKAELDEGWLVFEDYKNFYHSLEVALTYLTEKRKINDYFVDDSIKNVGFAKITFN